MSQLSVDRIIAQGGEALVELLKYCVYCRELDPLFLMLVRNYQMLPSAAKAMAIYNTFQEHHSLLKISGEIPARRGDALLLQAIAAIVETDRRILQQQSNEPVDDEGAGQIVPFLPARYLFDASVNALKASSRQFTRIEKEYDPELGAYGNLPERKIDTVQTAFIEHRWKPARAVLGSAGFYLVANIGG